ncbi:GntR family transcriptional regulator [Streptomyces sp. NPDC101132]|uniref:GntR family transcriptional regulator n=1 Tax=Streptomyces sp. NPDC101132 TaxID=3366110 RepID=UPI0037FD9325
MSTTHLSGPRADSTPAYQRIAAALRAELGGSIAPGARLPAERALSVRFGANRQTVRAALQLLRAEGLVSTDRRGTYNAAAAAPPVRRPSAPDFPGGLAPRPGTTTRSLLRVAGLPAAPAAAMGLAAGRQVLVHQHQLVDGDGVLLQQARTWFSPTAVDAVPELRRHLREAPTDHAELRHLHAWFEREGLAARVTDTISIPAPHRSGHQPAPAVRRTVHDQDGRPLAITDLSYPASRQLVWHHTRPTTTSAPSIHLA